MKSTSNRSTDTESLAPVADFFISYTKKDLEWAEWIAWTLEDHGYKIVIQAWDFHPGANFVLEMQKAMNESTKTIIVLSQDYLNAAFTQSEWAAAFARDPTGEKRLLIPIRVSECKPEGLLETLIYIDLVGLTEQEAIGAVLSFLEGDRAKPPQPPTFPPTKPSASIGSAFPGGVQEIQVFFSYAHKDKALADELSKHLSLLRKQGIISTWYDRQILPGMEWANEIDDHLNASKIVLLLISADFIASEYCYGVEMERAISRHEKGQARVIPIILRPCDWFDAPFSKLQALPRDGKAVTSWSNHDEAFLNIAQGIRLACKELKISPRDQIEEQNRILKHEVRVERSAIYELIGVFKYPGVPDITFVEPDNFYSLKLALKQPGLGVVIEGPSGIGKTTALRKAIEQLKADGNLDELEVLSARRQEDVRRLGNIEQWHDHLLAVDDFHRLDRSLQNHVADYLKEIADRENPAKLVIVGIPGTGKSLVEVSFDLATRIRTFKLGRVNDNVIKNMICKGETALNLLFDRRAEIVIAAGGSLNIAQILCSNLAAQAGINKTQEETKIVTCDLEAAVSEVMEQLTPKFEDVIRCFASLDGHGDSTCIKLIEELGHSENGFLSLPQLKDRRYELSTGIDRFLSEDYMTRMRVKFPDYERYLYYDERAFALVVDDPQLTFYLVRTSAARLAQDVGKF